jgi:predicted nucleotidyltransferase component of viral defense system/DNA-directed RNA polymerase subunit L
MIESYRDQARLMLEVLLAVSKVEDFALKGGTAINFFWRDLPRLSIDIDLTYLSIKNRQESLQDIKSGIQHIAEEVGKRLPETRITKQKSGGTVSKLIVRNISAQIKMEVNTVLRGTIYDAVEKEIKPNVQEEFELFAAIKTLSLGDLYGGKLCAALDRQHPRDLYDIKLLLENEGITDDVRIAFIGYLISHSRPIHELLNPNPIDITAIYEKEFKGMTNERITMDELVEVQHTLPKLILDELTEEEKLFLISFQQVHPLWNLIPVPHLQDMPAVQWKLLNIKKMDKQKHQKMGNKLQEVLKI